MTLIDDAAQLLRNGRLVAFPTETVYGLGADATNSAAIGRIFAAKGRPLTNPLIVHVADVSIAKRYVTHWPAIAEKLAAEFWPGPLTLVLPKASAIVNEVTAGLSTVGLRIPDHPIALELLRAFDGPIAAPSANRSNHISPTRALHVHDELGDAVDLVLDGGPCAVGIESTVLDLTTATPTVLRPGDITQQRMESIIGRVNRFSGTTAHEIPSTSPGQHERHYSPRTPTYRYDAPQNIPAHTGVLTLGKTHRTNQLGMIRQIELPSNPAGYAQHLYAALRELDSLGLDQIYIQMPPDEPQWTAIRDRLMRAAKPLAH